MYNYLLACLVALGFLLPVDAHSANDYRLVIINHTSHTMTSVQVAHIGGGDWGDNLLEDSIAPGDSAQIYVSGNENWCRFHIHADLRGGIVADNYNFNACALSAWTIEQGD